MIRYFVGFLALSIAAASNGTMFQANSATAGSVFSGLYAVNNAINGTGLPGGFTPSSPHAAYATNNHWTTLANAINNGTAWAEFSFTSAVTMGTFYMWNHQSNGGIASNPDYDVTRFNLRLYDASNAQIASFLNVSAAENISTAQVFNLGIHNNVKKVRFEILANARPNNDSYTGLAEVAFDTEAVPEPATVASLLLGGLVLARRRNVAR